MATGWGNKSWGASEWGDLSDETVLTSSVAISSSIGTPTIDAEIQIGWGRVTWGNWAWGVNYSVALGGIALSTAIGNEDAFSDVVVAVSGIGLLADITPVGTSGTSDNEIAHSFLLNQNLGSVSLVGTGVVQLTGISLSSAVSAVETATLTEVPVTGVSLQTTIGNEDITGNGLVVVTGTGSTYTIGNSTPVSGYDVSGISATYAAPGSVVITGGATVVPTGIGLTITVASPNIIAWAEVDVGTPVTWSPVDLAA